MVWLLNFFCTLHDLPLSMFACGAPHADTVGFGVPLARSSGILERGKNQILTPESSSSVA